MMKVPAKWWRPAAKGKVVCELCPRYCRIGDGQHGFCFVRVNEGGALYLTAYARPTGLAVDPIEKKPLNHFLPGTNILSFGTAGCNLGCRFCQNWDISKAELDQTHSVEATPERIVALAKRYNCPSIAYTYNDPTIIGEFVIDVARLARQEGIRSVMVTSGYITPQAREEIYPLIDAANVDLKAFNERFYWKLSFAHLEPVLDTIKWLVNETEVWVELTTLLIPGWNDSADELAQLSDWVLENCGAGTPLHFTAFHPDFKMTDIPPTPPQTLRRARELAMQRGLKFVYVGNVYDTEGQTTWCPNCGEPLIERGWQTVHFNRMVGDHCRCGEVIPGVF